MTPRYARALRVLDAYQPSPPCSCDECKAMCRRPCWPTPAEAGALMDAGHGHLLMVDGAGFNDASVLCPGCPGSERREAPWPPTFGCVFQSDAGLCLLHDAGLKPLEGRVAHCEGTPDDLHHDIARAWDTAEGVAVVARWIEENGEPRPAMTRNGGRS